MPLDTATAPPVPPKHGLHSTLRKLGVLLGGFALIFVFALLLVRIPLPMKKAPVPTELTQFERNITAFYHYDLGGFIDSEFLWRIEAAPDTIAEIVQRLKLFQTNAVPTAFYKMSPIGWPDSLPADAGAFQSIGFVGDGRGHDGMHYFLLHDKHQGKAYVWVKYNF